MAYPTTDDVLDKFLSKATEEELERTGFTSVEELRQAVVESGVVIQEQNGSFSIREVNSFTNLKNFRSAVKIYRFFLLYRLKGYSYIAYFTQLLVHLMNEEGWKRPLSTTFTSSIVQYYMPTTDIDIVKMLELLSHVVYIKKNMGNQYVQDLLRLDISICPSVTTKSITQTIDMLISICNNIFRTTLGNPYGKYRTCIKLRIVLEMLKYISIVLHVTDNPLTKNHLFLKNVRSKLQEIFDMDCASMKLKQEVDDYCMIILTLLP